MSGNRYFELLAKTASDLTLPFIRNNAKHVHLEGQHAILKALPAGNPWTASEAMRKHIVDNGKFFHPSPDRFIWDLFLYQPP
jgi:DNA-binding GntR family transcriptional regulator